ncbi:hypothetical protein D3C72_1671400 [compost metagenome]
MGRQRNGRKRQPKVKNALLLQRSDIAGNPDAQPFRLEPSGGPHDMDGTAVLVAIAVFKTDPLLSRHHLLGLDNGPVPVGGHDQIDDELARHILRRIAKNALARGADILDAAACVDQEYGVQQLVGKRSDVFSDLDTHGSPDPRYWRLYWRLDWPLRPDFSRTRINVKTRPRASACTVLASIKPGEVRQPEGV